MFVALACMCGCTFLFDKSGQDPDGPVQHDPTVTLHAYIVGLVIAPCVLCIKACCLSVAAQHVAPYTLVRRNALEPLVHLDECVSFCCTSYACSFDVL